MSTDTKKEKCDDNYHSPKSKWKCENFKEDDGDLSMESERYVCAVCGQYGKLYYSEMQ